MDKSITILVAGDFYPTGVPEEFPNWSKELSIIKEHDFALVNLEGPLIEGGQPINKVGPLLKINPKWASSLVEAGFNVATLANNHIMDQGESGFESTLEICHKAGLQTVGAGRNLAEAKLPLILEKGGIKIGILAFAEHEFSIASDKKPGASPVDPIENYYSIRELKSSVDYLIVILHGGNEYFGYPRPGLVKICRYYVESGADAVVCHHAHTTIGYEFYKGVPIYYGLGNFYFPTKNKKSLDWYRGFCISLRIDPRNIRLIETKVFPYVFNGCGVFPMDSLESLEYCKELTKKSEIIENPDSLLQKWEEFCQTKRIFLYNLLSYNRFDRYLFRLGLLKPEYFIQKILRLENYIDCDFAPRNHSPFVEEICSCVIYPSAELMIASEESMEQENSPINLLWTGGWDSTFRLLQLLLLYRLPVQPHYLIDSKRRSTKAKIHTMSKIKGNLFSKVPGTCDLLHVTKFYNVADIQPDSVITRSFNRIRMNHYIGSQYDWLARYCLKTGITDFELSIHRDDQAHKVIEPMVTIINEVSGKLYQLDWRFNYADEYKIFRNFRFPLFDMSKMEMEKVAVKEGFLDLMNLTWFCHQPLPNLQPCGICKPCIYTIQEGLGRRVPPISRLMYSLCRIKGLQRLLSGIRIILGV